MNLMDSYGKTKDRYLELIHELPLRPIRSDVELDVAIDKLRDLHDRPTRDEAEQDYAEVLGELIERFQGAQRQRVEFSNGEVLSFLLQSRDLSANQLAVDIGIAESAIAQAISGEPQMDRELIDRLATYFKVLPNAFLTAG